jgi:hypothetical protein
MVFLLFVALASFATIPSGTASLIAPTVFVIKSQMGELTGWELDFTTQADQCVSWLGETGRFPSGWCRQMVCVTFSTKMAHVEANNAIAMHAQDAATPVADISGGSSPQNGYEQRYSGQATGVTSDPFESSAPPIEKKCQQSQPPRAICLSENKMLDILDSGRDNVRLVLAYPTKAPLIYSYVSVPDRCSRCLSLIESTKFSQGCSALKQEYHSSARQGVFFP